MEHVRNLYKRCRWINDEPVFPAELREASSSLLYLSMMRWMLSSLNTDRRDSSAPPGSAFSLKCQLGVPADKKLLESVPRCLTDQRGDVSAESGETTVIQQVSRAAPSLMESEPKLLTCVGVLIRVAGDEAAGGD